MKRSGGAVVDGEAGTAAAHWDASYNRGERTVSWYQSRPTPSLRMIQATGIDASAAVIDVGGGTSRLVDALLDQGFGDLTVLDVSTAAIAEAKRRLAAEASRVAWIVNDVRSWRPARRFAIWHDRAVFHFHVERPDLDRYLAALEAGTEAGSFAIFATFAPDGPSHCSGLPVARYGPEQIAATLGDRWELVLAERELHTTPSGNSQPFSWALLQRRDAQSM